MKLIALGDNCVDVYRNLDEVHPGGNAVNVAVHAARCGAQAEYLGNLADDAYAQRIIEALEKNGVRTDRCPRIPHSITKRCIYDVNEGERTFIGIASGSAWAGPIQLDEYLLSCLNEADVIVSSCNAKIPEQMCRIAKLAPAVVFDFGEKEKYRTPEYYDQVCCGLDLAMFSCRTMSDEDFAGFAQPLHQRGVMHVLATMGADGQIISNGSEILRKPVRHVIPHDTMGAGDSFLAAFVCSLQANSWKKGVRMQESVLAAALEDGQKVSVKNVLSPGGFGE